MANVVRYSISKLEFSICKQIVSVYIYTSWKRLHFMKNESVYFLSRAVFCRVVVGLVGTCGNMWDLVELVKNVFYFVEKSTPQKGYNLLSEKV